MLKLTTSPADTVSAEGNHTFQFSSPNGLSERDAMKDYITQALARIRGSSPSTPSAIMSPIPTSTSTTPTPPSTTGTPAPATPANLPPGVSSDEMTTRGVLLSKSKELHTLFEELVVRTRTVTDAEFWESPFVKKIRQVSHQLFLAGQDECFFPFPPKH